jgi:hypothetical protein
MLIRLLADLSADNGAKHMPATIRLTRVALELEEARAKLRALCADVNGDNSWPDDLYLPDVIDKYIVPAVDAEIDRAHQLHR